MTDYAAGYGRPAFDAAARLVVRRAMTGYRVGDEMPAGDMTARQIAILWDQGWIDTLPLEQAPAAHKAKGKTAATELGK